MSEHAPIDLVVFTCAGREHLLRSTLASLAESVRHPFRSRLLVIDGAVNETLIGDAEFDLVLRRPKRSGYVRNILSALSLVEAEQFFWLEDDWRFEAPVDLSALSRALTSHPSWVQIRLSKTGRLSDAEKAVRLSDDIYASTVGFSANPCLCRTATVRDALQSLTTNPRGARLGVDGFENVLSRVFSSRGLVCGALDSPGVSHLGYLESTPRQFHMTASLDGALDEHLISLGTSPPLWRRLWMAARLAQRFGAVTVGQLRSDAYYDLAFRMITVPVTHEAEQ